MGEFFKNIGNWTTQNSNTLANLGKFASPMIDLGVGVGQYKTAKENNELARDSYNYNKSFTDRNIAQQNMSQNNITNAFDTVFGATTKKKKLGEFSGMMNFEG